jgi:hypothetical protein
MNAINSDMHCKDVQIYDVANEYVQTVSGFQNLLLRPVIYISKAIELSGGILAESAKEVRKVFNNSYQLLYWTDFPGKMERLFHAAMCLEAGLSSGSFWEIQGCVTDLFIKFCFAAGLVKDGVGMLQDAGWASPSPLHATVLSYVGFFSNIAWILWASKEIRNEVVNLTRAKLWSPEGNLSLIRLVARVCFLSFGCIGLGFSVGLSFNSWLMFAIGVTSLLSSVSGHFYEKMVVNASEKPVA